MKVEIVDQVNPIFECIDILTRYISDYSYINLKKELKTKLGVQVEEIENLLDFLQNISLQVTKGINKKDSIFNVLFYNLGTPDYTPAKAIFQYYGDFSERDLEKIEQGVLKAFRENPTDLLYTMLDNYNLLNIGHGKNSIRRNSSAYEIMEACSLADRDKWMVLAFYHDFESYLHHLMEILATSIDAFKQFIPDLQPWIEPFYEQFSVKINSQTICSYAKEKFNLIIPETNDILIQPSLFNCCRLDYLDTQVPGHCSNILLGMHFETIFAKQFKDNSSTHLCNNLKLLGDKSKFDILKLLASKRSYGGELAKTLGLSTGTIAYHLRFLVSAHFVTVDKRGYRIYYELNKSAVNEFLEQVKHQLNL